MITPRWAGYIVAAICLIVLFHERNLLVVLILAAAFLAIVASFGGLNPRTWVADAETSRHLAAVDEDIDRNERAQRRAPVDMDRSYGNAHAHRLAELTRPRE